MSERAAALQAVQIGLEAVPGTPIAADVILNTLADLTPAVQVNVDQDRVPTGQKFPTYVIPGREWVQAGFTGQQSFGELPYFLAGIFGPADVAPAGAGAAKTWQFTPSRAAQDFPATYTIEQGNPERAHKYSYGFMSELGLRFTPDEATMSGTMMARSFADNIGAMTADPTSPELVPIMPAQVAIYLDPLSGDIGETKLTRAFACEVGISDKYSALYTIDRANARGFAALVERRPTITMGLTMESDAAGMANLTRLRNGDSVFARIEAIGGVIGAGPATYKMTWDMALKVVDMGDFGDEQDVVANDWSFRAVYDGTWGKAVDVQVVNQVAAL